MTKEEFNRHSEEVYASWDTNRPKGHCDSWGDPHPCYDCGRMAQQDVFAMCPGCGRVICEDCWNATHHEFFDEESSLFRCVNQVHRDDWSSS